MGLLEVTDPSVAYMCLGGFVVAFSLISLLARERLYVNEVVLGTLVGVFIGPYFAGIFDPRGWSSQSDHITLEVMRIVLATGLFAIGVELPKSYLAKHVKSLSIMVIPTMCIGWVIVAGILSLLLSFKFSLTLQTGFLRLLFPWLHFVSCLAVSACLTPTDPIICAAIVGNTETDLGPMGVGAVFISTMAITRLPEPHHPPESREDYLLIALESVVPFLVLASIIIHGLSIPFFNLGVNVTRTVSISTLTISRSRLYPDWALSVNNPPTMNTGNEAVITTVIQPEPPGNVKEGLKMATQQKVESAASGVPVERPGQEAVIVEESRPNPARTDHLAPQDEE
ncbi:hypothetical protein CVT24_000180 [Panaeolus cyanescens]|uniref:Cation/H+ exchanger transmembrane domain-containing protein n=1 Tax=Panaeolus cyanescens TaxID=181874 RepID=A0A409VWT0_9AGAR|nr:hypothetical protein CVT24_000180 [Panaeolus cyanescens]